MTEDHFTLLIDGDVDAHIDELSEAGCDDAVFGAVDGAEFADFDRESETFAHAVVSAIRAVESVDDLRVRRVDPEELVTLTGIADRLGRTRQSVHRLAAGERGADFPRPVSHLRSRTRLWRWTDIVEWAGKDTADEIANGRVLAAANAALELRDQTRELSDDAAQELVALAGAVVA